MTTMSDDGDRTCPLCAEEMDLTDLQLKPCKCGYEICVWCWHQIMDMAEKDGSEGRCPACRTAYDKQRIEAANCKRVVAEIGADKKHKSQKTKNRTSSIDDRKHLSSVRVVQRNLVYITGMPSNLADENILERKEYFGQYGKILKVSISRQAGTTAQQANNNNTFGVYITYAQEEAAIRCIQAVHNFILEGKPLRACFGTTKYCYTWLRNMTCSNPDCLYLHDIGSQEDSFTKDEIISAYTRSRVPQISSDNLQPRTGNVLPPSVDDLYNNVTASSKPSSKISLNNTTNQVNSVPMDTSGPRSTVLPAAASWGLRSSNCRQPALSISCSQNPLKQKTEVLNISSNSSTISSTKQNYAWHEDVIPASKMHNNGRGHLTKVSDSSAGSSFDTDHISSSAWDDDITTSKMPDINDRFRNSESSMSTDLSFASDTPAEVISDDVCHSAWDDDQVSTSNISGVRQILHNDDRFSSSKITEPCVELSRAFASDESRDRGTNVSRGNTDPVNTAFIEGDDCDLSSSSFKEIAHSSSAENGNMESLCLGLSSANLDTSIGIDHMNMGREKSSGKDHHSEENFEKLDLRSEQYYPEEGAESLAFISGSNTSVITDSHVSGKLYDWNSGLQKQASSSTRNGIEDVSADDWRQRLSVAPNFSSSSSYRTCSRNTSNNLPNSFQNGEFGERFSPDGGSKIIGSEMSRDNEYMFFNGHKEETGSNFVDSERVLEYPNVSYEEKELYSGSFDNISNVEKIADADNIEEESIVSKMLSSDFDPWDNIWSSANNVARLLAQGNIEEGQLKQSSSWTTQNTNQSRFQFARPENQANLGDRIYRDIGHSQLVSSKEDIFGSLFVNSSPASNLEYASMLGNRSSTFLSDNTSAVMRTNMSAPPGFSFPNRAPPPGFSSQDRYDQAFNTYSETQLLGSPHQNHFQLHSSSNAGDVEFIDPAILAVGKGRLPLGVKNTGLDRLPLGVNNTVLGSRSAYNPQFSTAESDARIQLLMQQSLTANQDPRFSNHIGDRFLQLDDAYISSRFSTQNPGLSPYAQLSHQQPSHILNNQWNGWNDVQVGNGMGIAEVLRSERFGLNNYFAVNEEPKFHVPNSGDLYNRTFGM